MFVHAPEKLEIPVHALVVWDDPDLACQAVSMCRGIERRSGGEGLKFRIEETGVLDLESRGDEVRHRACEADVVLVALHRMILEPPGFLKTWFSEWSQARERQSGALAMLRPPDPVDQEELHRLLREEMQKGAGSVREQEFRQFLEGCAKRARMEFFWGRSESGLESELEEATRGMRILEAPAAVPG